jgi:hypothetical protein
VIESGGSRIQKRRKVIVMEEEEEEEKKPGIIFERECVLGPQ